MALVSKGLFLESSYTKILAEIVTPIVSASNSLHVRPHLMTLAVLDLASLIFVPTTDCKYPSGLIPLTLPHERLGHVVTQDVWQYLWPCKHHNAHRSQPA